MSRVDDSYTERADTARRLVERDYPGAEDVTVSIAFGRCIVDFRHNDAAVRVEHFEPEDRLAIEQAEAATRIKLVKQGALT